MWSQDLLDSASAPPFPVVVGEYGLASLRRDAVLAAHTLKQHLAGAGFGEPAGELLAVSVRERMSPGS
jgi:hypothetical protein